MFVTFILIILFIDVVEADFGIRSATGNGRELLLYQTEDGWDERRNKSLVASSKANDASRLEPTGDCNFTFFQ